VRLQDVYWSEEGRASLDAVIMAAVFGGLVVLGVQPWGMDESGSIVGTGLWVVVTLLLVGITFMKGRILLALLGIFVMPLAAWGTLRLAKPTSPFAKRYGPGKLARSRERYRPDRPAARLGDRFLDLIGGRPSLPDPPPPYHAPEK